jgi:hypothetical protein
LEDPQNKIKNFNQNREKKTLVLSSLGKKRATFDTLEKSELKK